MEGTIEFSIFRQLLQSLENSSTLVRLRVSGEAWMEFSEVILLSESAMILQDGTRRKIIMNVRNVVEFELDEPVLDLRPHRPYEIIY